MRDSIGRDIPPSSSSSSSLDREPDPLHNCRSTDELLDYVALLENELENLKLQNNVSQTKHQDEKSHLLERLEAAIDKMNRAEGELQARKKCDALTQSTLAQLTDECRRTERLLEQERRIEKNLEDKIQMLEFELQAKNDLINHRRKRDEKSRKRLEKENEMLKKKATLGWMLGCLSEVYLQSEPEGTAVPLLKMVRNIQRELERENVVLSYSNGPPQMHLEYVEKEIHRLIDCARLVDAETKLLDGKTAVQARIESGPSTQRSFPEDVAGSVEDGIHSASVVASKPQGQFLSNTRIYEDSVSPSTRYIINCFAEGSKQSINEIGNDRTACGNEFATADQRTYGSHRAKIEMFEANPETDVEHSRLTGSTWAEIKVLNKQGAEAAEMLHCQTDIKRMLSRLELSMEQLLEQQKQLPQLPPAPSSAPHVQDRALLDLGDMLSGAYALKKKNKASKSGVVKRASGAKVGSPMTKMKPSKL
ncbi:hypothetical protein KP509_36G055100 [Ceratopteris richardii]|uniref:Uncharacterized protein n=1 Tax=Ceratopteris richardii TaxID=49495 RepID=A0A8T2QCN3_CERRI|nr:hypothetical protein KP509_36G055100 [Ceratopteris richardii]